MTPGVGLSTWNSIGSLNRELKPYVEYTRRGWKVKILTFDRDKIPELPDGIEAVRFPDCRLLWFLPWMCKELGLWADVIKTNQSNMVYYYTRAAKIWNKPILLRCGYVQGEYFETTRGFTFKTRLYQWFESRAFRQATHCQVPTEELSQWVQIRYKVQKKKSSVVPNFVDTDIFKPLAEIQKKLRSVVSVGRLHPVKQFDLLIKACAEIPECTLTIIGEGPERQNLEHLANESGVDLNLPGNVPNEELPGLLQKHQIYVSTSKWEGHPKALIEAMACGLPCLAVRTAGIENLINHGVNGWLVDNTRQDVKNGLNLLLNNGSICENISGKAKQFIIANYSFEDVMKKEFDIIQNFIK